MHATDRVVLVGAGFGVWRDGRHLASARWSDVVHVRAFRRTEGTSTLLHVSLRLHDGSEVLLDEKVPGFGQFLVAAEQALRVVRPRSSWRAGMAEADVAPDGAVLFDREARVRGN